MAMSKERRLRIKGTDVLIIDEISMLESNQFRRLDRACRAARSCDAAFGGIQVVVTGDFCQLPPVKAFQTCFECGVELRKRVFCVDCQPLVDEDIHRQASSEARKACLRCGVEPLRWSDCPECRETYNMDDEWAFRSDTWEGCGFHCVSLTQVHRQSDPTFIDILNTLRIGDRLDTHQLALLTDGKAVSARPSSSRPCEERSTGRISKVFGGSREQYVRIVVKITSTSRHTTRISHPRPSWTSMGIASVARNTASRRSWRRSAACRSFCSQTSIPQQGWSTAVRDESWVICPTGRRCRRESIGWRSLASSVGSKRTRSSHGR